MERIMEEDSAHCCLIAIGRLQVTSTPNISDLSGSNSNSGIVKGYLGFWYYQRFDKWWLFQCDRIYIETFDGWKVYLRWPESFTAIGLHTFRIAGQIVLRFLSSGRPTSYEGKFRRRYVRFLPSYFILVTFNPLIYRFFCSTQY